MGTLDYVAPERIRGGGDGPAADLYSLGCVLYYALTGRVVFEVEGAERKLWAHLSEPPPERSRASTRCSRGRWRRIRRSGSTSGAELGAAAIAAAGVAWTGSTRRGARRGDRARRTRRSRRLPRGAGRAGARGVAGGADRAALADTPVESVERRLAAVRAGSDPGKARLVAALASQLAVDATDASALDGWNAEIERIVVELETVRGRVLADEAEPPRGSKPSRTSSTTVAARLAAAGGESTT